MSEVMEENTSEEFVLYDIFFYTEKHERNNCLNYLREIIVNTPHPIAIYAARYLVLSYSREILPLWVSILSNGDPSNWSFYINVARLLIYEEAERET